MSRLFDEFGMQILRMEMMFRAAAPMSSAAIVSFLQFCEPLTNLCLMGETLRGLRLEFAVS